MTTEQKNMELMQTLDDAWNAQDWDTFDKRHKPDVVVRWPAQPPTHGRHDHRAEGTRQSDSTKVAVRDRSDIRRCYTISATARFRAWRESIECKSTSQNSAI